MYDPILHRYFAPVPYKEYCITKGTPVHPIIPRFLIVDNRIQGGWVPWGKINKRSWVLVNGPCRCALWKSPSGRRCQFCYRAGNVHSDIDSPRSTSLDHMTTWAHGQIHYKSRRERCTSIKQIEFLYIRFACTKLQALSNYSNFLRKEKQHYLEYDQHITFTPHSSSKRETPFVVVSGMSNISDLHNRVLLPVNFSSTAAYRETQRESSQGSLNKFTSGVLCMIYNASIWISVLSSPPIA